MIDRCEWRFRKYDARHGPHGSIFLPFMCRPRIFEIRIFTFESSSKTYDYKVLSSLMGSLCISLTSPATLEELEISILFRSELNPFGFLDTNMFCKNLRDAEAWSRLDSITTHPSGLRLRRVNIRLDYSLPFDDRIKKKVLKAIYAALPLLRKKGILFVKVTWD